MSGSAFDGLPRTEPSSESYEGAGGFDPMLVTDVVQPYLDGILERRLREEGSGAREATIAELAGIIGRRADAERFSPDGFLAHVVTRLTVAAEEEVASGAMGLYYPNALLDHLVQALYGLGYNGFHLDLQGLHEQVPTPMVIANGLSGSEERPLEMSYHGDAHSVGCHASRCLIHSYGKGRFIGSEADSATFILHDRMEIIGWGAKDSTFVVPSARMLWEAWTARFFHRDMGQEGTESMIPKGCSFYVDESPQSDLIGSIQGAWLSGPAPLFLYANRLFVRPTEDEWKEVTIL